MGSETPSHAHEGRALGLGFMLRSKSKPWFVIEPRLFARASMKPRQPDFIIIGAMKSATSSLHEQLAAQPGFWMSNPKEPNFFSDEPEFAQGLEHYWRLFKDAPPGSLCGESSTHYSKLPRHPYVVERLAKYVPDAKFIYVMRHPIDRLVSHYIHEWTERMIDRPIGEAIDQHSALVDFSRYSMQLQPYFEQFGRERVLPVFFDRLHQHSQAELERICRFLGYEGEPRWRDLDAQNVSSQRMRTSWIRDTLVYLPGVSFIRKHLVPQRVRDEIKRLWMMNRRPELTDAQRIRLERVFDDDLKRLGEWLGVPLSCTNFKSITRAQSLEWTTS